MGTSDQREEPEDLISITQFMRNLAEEPEPEDSATDDGAPGAPRSPRITRMPDGIEVVERRLGHAVGRWVMQVRCDCGRRWFEVETVKTADCPRCGALVMIDVDPR